MAWVLNRANESIVARSGKERLGGARQGLARQGKVFYNSFRKAGKQWLRQKTNRCQWTFPQP